VTVIAGGVDLGLDDLEVRVLDNPRWAEGQATSLAVAIDAADVAGAPSVVVGLGDQPLVGAGAWRAVATEADGPIVSAAYDGERRPPVRLDRSVWPLLPRTGDDGARTVMREHPELVRAVAVPGDPIDIDTTDDLARAS
jgi:CTP:molybdopterin cytidylyltransferase MocA